MSNLEDLRQVAFATAYKMLGRVSEAEDIAQEALLRWHRMDSGNVRSPAAYIARVAINLSIDQAKRDAAERSTIARDWLPELMTPAETADETPDLTYATLVALQALTPLERAVFLLRMTFDCDYAEIAETLNRKSDACRQAMQRARRILRDGRAVKARNAKAEERLLRTLVDRVVAGDLDGLRKLLSDDVVVRADAGRKGPALKRPLQGGDAAARFLLASRELLSKDARTDFAAVAGGVAAVARVRTRPVLAVLISARGAKITNIFALAHPEKIGRLHICTEQERRR